MKRVQVCAKNSPAELLFTLIAKQQDLPSGKHTYKKLWKITIFNGKTHYKWQFSIAMLTYRRVRNPHINGHSRNPFIGGTDSIYFWPIF